MNYSEFVKFKLSPEYKYFEDFYNRIQYLNETYPNINIPLLLGGSMMCASEGAEVAEIVRKVIFQGKELDKETIEHLLKELGDLRFGIDMECQALNVTLEEIEQLNREKLNKRYKESFTVQESENRTKEDV